MRTIFIREIHDLMTSTIFMTLLAASVVLGATNGVLFSSRYQQKLAAYNSYVNSGANRPSAVACSVYREPNPYLFLAEGGDRARPNGIIIKPGGVFDAMPSGIRNHRMPDTSDLDWAFIIKLVGSIYVILLGFRQLSGERESGTLKLVLSNSIGRGSLLAAKYLAVMSASVIPLVIGILFSLIILGVAGVPVLSLAGMSSVALMMIISFAYLSIFAALSLLVSSLFRDSSVVLLVLLIIWVCGSIAVPNTAGILADKFTTVPREYKTASAVNLLINSRLHEGTNDLRRRAERNEFASEAELKRANDEICNNLQNDLIALDNEFENAMRHRRNMARTLASISPAALFEYSLQNLVMSGARGEESFLRRVREFSRIYDRYIAEKTGKLISTSNWSFSYDLNFQGRNIMMRSPYPEEYDGDMSDFPQFVETGVSPLRSTGAVLGNLTVLILWNLGMAFGAFFAFSHADVR